MFANVLTSAKSRQGKVETTFLSQDEKDAYEDIMELLLTGGYFRARIQGLSNFDKITGGMSWCITAANEGEELDIDVFFKEESSLGERLAIAESICKALLKMRCPEKIEPHQIQGGKNSQDYIAILRVIRWLVKKVIETRKETGDLMRKFSQMQFGKEHTAPEDVIFEEAKPLALQFGSRVAQQYRAERKHRRKGRRVKYLNPRAPEDNIASALLEYGEFYSTSSSSSNSGSSAKSQLAKRLEATLQSSGPDDSNDDERRRKLEAEMMGTGELDEELARKFLMGQNLEELESQYGNMAQEGPQRGKFGQQSHEAQVLRLNKAIESEMRDLNDLKELFTSTQQAFEEAQLQYNKRQTYNQQIRDALKRFDEMITPENRKQLEMLKSLVGLNENLKFQEQAFKENCLRCRDDFKKRIEGLKKELQGESSGETDEIERTFQEDFEKLKKVRQELAKKNRNIVRIERTLDEIPGRVELSQYQRQFIELFDQSSTKQTEHRQYTNTYNSLVDRRKYIQNEIDILENIIRDNGWKRAMSTKDSKANFLGSLEVIVKNVKNVCETFSKQLQYEKDTKTELDENYKNLLEKERTYTKLTKEYQLECQRNQELQDRLDELQPNREDE